MALSSLIDRLELLRPIVKIIPVLGSQIEGAVETVITICKNVEVRRRVCCICAVH